MRKTKKLALASILSALGVVMLYFGALIDALDLSFTLIASFCLLFAQRELGRPYPVLIYATTSVLALLVLPTKYVVCLYILIGGFYPLIRPQLMRLRFTFLRRAIKFLLFAALFTLTVVLSRFVFGIEDDGGRWAQIAVIVLGTVTYVLYDLLLGMIPYIYEQKIRPRIARYLK